MFAGKTIDYLDNCDRDAYVHSSHQCVPSPKNATMPLALTLKPAYTRHVTDYTLNRLAQACVLLFYSHKASAQLTSAAWVPGTGQTRI